MRSELERLSDDEFWIAMERREKLGASAPKWMADRREQYLLRLDVVQPLSVDRRVWPVETGDAGSRVAISVVDREAPARVHSIWFPHEIEGEVHLLGYDVADAVFTSGLSNCGYTHEEKMALCPTWAPRINRFHLLERLELALEFRAVTDARVPEHAPFFVFGIYLISDG